MRTPLCTFTALTLGALSFGAPSVGALSVAEGALAPGGEEAAAQPAVAPALAAALDSIRAENIEADLHFFASDEMQGRDTPSPEQRIAARFLAARLDRLGWTPGAQEGSWFWEYELPTVVVDAASSHLTATVDGRDLRMRLGEHYGFSAGRGVTKHDVSAEGVVYAGTLQDEEVEGLELEGRWMLVRSGEDLDWRKIMRTSRELDAAGILVAPGAGLDANAVSERIADYFATATKPRLSRGGVRESRSIPYLYLTEDALEMLLQAGGATDPKVGDVIDVTLREERVVDASTKAGLENVIGLWPGSDPKLKNEVILLSAHYDHVGTGDDGVFNGADDNGSGSMCLLNVAEALTHYGPMRRSVMILWVSGEEKGLLGSAAWTKDPYLPEGMTPVLNINIDMVGRNAPEKLMITPTSEHEAYNGLTRLAEQNRAFEGFEKLQSADAYWSRSDHANFSRNLEIPVAFLFSDVHEDYHKVTDTPDKIDYDKIRRVARLVVRMVDGLQTDVLDLD